MTYRFSVKEALLKSGMTDAFDPGKADFRGMGGRPHDLFVSAVLHKAFVDVNEEGTEAAAATAVVMEFTMARVDPPQPPALEPLVAMEQKRGLLFPFLESLSIEWSSYRAISDDLHDGIV